MADDVGWHPDYPHADAAPSKGTSYSFQFCKTDRNVRVVATIHEKMRDVALGRDFRSSVQLIFAYYGGDVQCEGGVISKEDLVYGFRMIFSRSTSTRSLLSMSNPSLLVTSPGKIAQPAAPQMHTLITKGFHKLTSSNISELKQIKIMLVGMVNAGKSSFLNVLLGLDKEIHFPTNESSWTRIITKLKYGPTKKWCLRTTDEKESCVTEQYDFDPTDSR